MSKALIRRIPVDIEGQVSLFDQLQEIIMFCRECWFDETPIQLTKKNGVDYFVLKPFIEAIGLNWRGQQEFIERDALLISTRRKIRLVGKDGKKRKMLCMELEALPSYLFKLDPNQYPDERGEMLLAWQREVKAAIFAWQNGEIVFRSSRPAKADPADLAPILGQFIMEFREFREDVTDRVSKLEKGEARKALSVKTVNQHIFIIQERFGGLCPCCQKNQVVLPSGRLTNEAEKDHWFARYKNGLHDTWIICSQCHNNLTRDIWTRADKQRAFNHYQDIVKRVARGKSGGRIIE